MPRCTLVLTGAPLAERCTDMVGALQVGGYEVDLVVTEAASAWVDIDDVSAATGAETRIHAQPGATSPRKLLPDVVVVCPATFNTINKVAEGIADTRTHSFLCECVGAGVQMVLVPMINDRLWNHPALGSSMQLLAVAGALFLHPQTGTLDAAPVISGSGAQLVAGFDPSWIVAALDRQS
jgi:phosphopantothenoylcysteine synthetase/decarboxylase